MKVALLISGYLRSYDINLKFIEDEILNKFEHVDVYLHVTKNETEEDKYQNATNEEEAINIAYRNWTEEAESAADYGVLGESTKELREDCEI